MNDKNLDPMLVMRLSSAYWHSSVVHVANQLDIFTILGDGPKSASQLASAAGADERGMEMIAIACVELGLLEKQGELYSNSANAETFLVKSSPRYQGGIISMFEAWVPAWSKLGDAVRRGEPVVEKQHDKGPEETRKYIFGMLYRGIPQAELLAEELSLAGRSRLIDVGGGPGIFSIILSQRNPGLTAEVFDLPQTLTITQEIISQYQAQEMVSTKKGSYLTDEFGHEDYDVVLLSSMINQEGPQVVKGILEKSYRALQPGGMLVLQEQLLNDEKTGPLLAVLIGLNQLVHTPAGKAYSGAELKQMAEAVGFRDISYRPLPEPSPFTLLTAVKH